MHLTPQAQTVLSHLRAHPHITSWTAQGVYSMRRLASRVDELRAAGFDIEKETVCDARGERYTRYSLSRAQKRRRTPINPPRQALAKLTLEVVTEAMLGCGYFQSEIDLVQRQIEFLRAEAAR